MGNGGRLGALVTAVALLLGACGDGGDGGDEQAVEDVVLEALLSDDPAKCTELFTLEYLERRSGKTGDAALAHCRKEARDTADDPDSAEVHVETLEDDYALTSGSLGGGPFDGSTFKYVLRLEDGDWVIDALTDVEVDRDDYDSYARDQLIEDEGLSPAEAGCAIDELSGLVSTEQLEEAARTGDELRAEGFEAAIECLSPQSKAKGLAGGLREAGEENGIDSGIVTCAVDRLRALPNRRIAALYAGYENPRAEAFLEGLLEKCASAMPAGET